MSSFFGDAGYINDEAKYFMLSTQMSRSNYLNYSPDLGNYHRMLRTKSRVSVVNMTDIVDVGSALEKKKTLRKMKDKVGNTVYNPEKAPEFMLNQIPDDDDDEDEID